MALKPGKRYGPDILVGKVDPVSFRRQVPLDRKKALEQVLPTLKRHHQLDLRIEELLGTRELAEMATSGPMHAERVVLVRVIGGAGWLVWGPNKQTENEIIEYGDWILVPPNTVCSLVGDKDFHSAGHPFVVTAARLVPKKGDSGRATGRRELTR